MKGGGIFYEEVKATDMKKRDHVIKNFYRKVNMGTFERYLYEGSFWIGRKAVISFIHKKKCAFNSSWRSVL